MTRNEIRYVVDEPYIPVLRCIQLNYTSIIRLFETMNEMIGGLDITPVVSAVAGRNVNDPIKFVT